MPEFMDQPAAVLPPESNPSPAPEILTDDFGEPIVDGVGEPILVEVAFTRPPGEEQKQPAEDTAEQDAPVAL